MPVSPPQLVVVVSPEQPLEERVVKQSVRFDEPRSLSNPSMAVPSPPLQAVAMPQPEPHANAPTKAAPIDVPTDAQSPWDIGEGPASTLDLDTTSRNTASPFTELLATSAVKPKTPSESLPATTSSAPAPSPVSAPPQESELDALMTGARELFELGDFSGSLELVEKVLRTDAGHEGARAYLKRNEATLTRMYESKLGAMSTVPRQLVPPDEVIWLNMHHRAGFILSQVDGMLSYEDLLEVSGMDRFDTVRILADLVQNGIIG